MKRYLLGVALAIAFALALVFAPFTRAVAQTQPDLEARVGADWMRLSWSPCTNTTIHSLIGEQDAATMHAGSAFIGGKLYGICWAESSGVVEVAYDDGDFGLVPWEMFQPVGG